MKCADIISSSHAVFVFFQQVNKSRGASLGSRRFHCLQMPALCSFLCSFAQQHLRLWWDLQLLGACELLFWLFHWVTLHLLIVQAICWVFFSNMSVSVVTTVLTDALPALRHRDANVGIFPAVRHQILCLPVVTRSSCLFACPCSTDKQGNYPVHGDDCNYTHCDTGTWAHVMTVLQVLVFYFVRCVLAFSCCVCELYFYKWVHLPLKCK